MDMLISTVSPEPSLNIHTTQIMDVHVHVDDVRLNVMLISSLDSCECVKS